jgi:hypothetical protein
MNKKIKNQLGSFLFSMCLLLSLKSQAQWGVIDSVKLIPQFPTGISTVQVICYSHFGSTACYMTDSSVNTNGNVITVNANHMQGMLTAICNSTDTLIIGSNFSPGGYTVVYKLMDIDTISYDVDTLYFFIEQVIGISENSTEDEIKIFPNPTTDQLHISCNPSQITEIEIADITGRQIYTGEKMIRTLSNHETIINLQSFPHGLFFIKLKMKDGSEVIRKFLKE